MKNNEGKISILLILVAMLCFSAFGLYHTSSEINSVFATGKTSTSASAASCDHNWSSATCTEPKTCTICKKTTGSSLGHDYDPATCTESKRCSRCGVTTGSPLGHNWSSWKQNEWFSGHYKECTRCHIKKDEGDCWGGTMIPDGDDQHCHNRCGTCGNPWGYEYHTITYINKEKLTHNRYCSICGYTKTENHNFNENHVCVTSSGSNKCLYAHPMKDHWFPEGLGACALGDYGCPESLKMEDGLGEVSSLPLSSQYTMIGHQDPTPEKSLSEMKITYNHIPYISESKTLLKPYVNLSAYTHGTYEEHAREAGLTVSESEGRINNDVFANGNVNEWRASWQQKIDNDNSDSAYFSAFLYGNDSTVYYESSGGKTFIAKMPSSGHYELNGYYVGGETVHLDKGHAVMFCNGGCNRSSSEATNIYGYVMVGYRDTDGNKIPASTDDMGNSLPGAPADSRTSGLVWKNGYANGGSYTRSVGPEHGDLDKAGYRYVGYKITNTFYVPSGSPGSISSGEGPASITAKFGSQKKCITYYYEKVSFDVEHVLVHSDGTQTKLPTNLNKSGMQLKGIQIERSVNKEIYPGYILTGYDKRLKDTNEVYNTKEYDWTYTNSSKEATTRPYTAAEKAQNPLPSNIISKNVEIRYNDTSKDSPGYRQDKKLTFYYRTIDVKITHIDKDAGQILKALDGSTSLSYAKDLTGQYLNEVSLELKNGPANLYMNGQAVAYDARGYILDSVKVKIDGISKELVITKELLEQYITAMNNQTITDSYQYIIDNFYLSFRLNINDTILRTIIQQELKDELNLSVVNLSQKMQRNTEVTWYYVRANRLVVRYEDNEGNSLTTPETVPIITNPVTPNPKPKDFPGYEIEKYELDGVEHPANPTTEVIVNDIGGNRELIFIYKPTEVPESTERIVELRSADRRADKNGDHSSEEYLVDAVDGQTQGAIPTSEDLYANVIVESFHMKDGIQLKENVEPTQKFEIRFIKQYVDENKENGNNDYTGTNDVKSNVSAYYVSFDIGYNYFTAENAKLQVIDHAVVKNASVEQKSNSGTTQGSVTLLPEYKNEPYMEFEKGGKLTVQSLGNVNFTNKKVTGTLKSGLYNVTEKTQADGSTVIRADFVLPSVEYMYPDIDDLVKQYRNTNDESVMSAEITEMRDNIYSTTLIKMDRLTIISDVADGGTNPTRFDVFTGANVPLIYAKNRSYLVSNKIINLNPSPDLTGRDVLYSENTPNQNAGNNKIFVKKTALNQLYNTTADVYYRTKQELKDGVLLTNPTDASIDLVITNEPGNTVTVHTPVVDNASLTVPSATDKSEVKNMWHSATGTKYKTGTDATLVLGQEFTITIPHNAQHLNLKGYGNTNYNWLGIFSRKNGINGATGEPKFPSNDTNNQHFAEDRQVKFTFGVIYQNTYCPPNEWISLGATNETKFNFTVPEWEEELWKSGKHKIYTRVIAENCPTSYYDDDTSQAYKNRIQTTANTDATRYIATKDFTVNVIGEILDLEIRATNDVGWLQMNSSVGSSELPLGQTGQNKNAAYKYGIKLGYTAFFDITTTGWKGDTTESIEITPKYYFVPKNGGNAYEVDLYYKKAATGPYLALKDNPLPLDTIMSKDCYKGINYVSRFAKLFVQNSGGRFALDAGRELTLTYPLLTKYGKNLVNYSSSISTGTTSAIKLPYATRLVYQKAIETLTTKYGIPNLPKKADGSPWDGTDYCDGHWYGAMWLPSTTVAVPKGNPAPKSDGTGKLTDGYIIVTFDDIITKDKENESYLEYKPADTDNVSNVTLPNGKTGSVPPDGGIPSVVYEVISDRMDYNQGMTH